MLSEGRLQEASDAFKQASATASSLLAKLHLHERALVANDEHATSDERAKMHQYLDDIKACERAQIKDAKQQKSVRIGYREYKGYVLLSEGGAHKGDLILVEDALLVAPNGSPQRDCSGDKWKAFLEELQEHFGRDSVDEMRALGMKMDLPEYEWLGPLAFWLLDEATQQKILELHAPDMSDDRVRERFAYLDPSSEHFVADSTLKQCCFASENEIDTFRTVARIFDNNSLACNSRQDELCLFQTFCRLSHSCEPNCARSSFEKDDGANSEGPKHTQALRALQDIESGEELTVSYLSDSELLECTYLRHGFLSKTKFFECNCERCAKELDTSRTFNCPSCGSSGSIVGKAAKAEGHEPCTSCGTSLGDQWSTFESNEEQMFAFATASLPANDNNYYYCYYFFFWWRNDCLLKSSVLACLLSADMTMCPAQKLLPKSFRGARFSSCYRWREQLHLQRQSTF